MDAFIKSVVNLSNWIWGPPLITLLVAGGLFLTFRLKFFHLKYLGYIFKQTFGKMFSKEQQGEGTVTPFQALTSAIACCVGAGNIVGVPTAIFLGGPGAVFWMWIVAMLGMIIKYAEVVLAVNYREKNALGEYVGGPMYYISKGLNMKWLAVIFSVGLMAEVIPSNMVQAYSLAASVKEMFSIPPIVSGLIVMVIVGSIVIGGITRIGKVTEKFVPFMAMFYLVGAAVIVIMNIGQLPGVFGLIFGSAFKPMAAVGGFAGSTIAFSIRQGFARGLYSNEAGVGTAPIAHAAASVDHPVRQGLWGIMEVFIDTVVICTATAFVVLITGVWQAEGITDPGALTTMAFSQSLGSFGGVLVSLALIMFVLSTIPVLCYYGEKQAEFLGGLNFAKVVKYIYVLSIPIGAVGGAQVLWNFLDITLAIAVIPNMIGVILLNKDVVQLTQEFFSSEKYYLKDIGQSAKKI